jgi:cupin fold WbuC family metalloprotein
LPGRNNGLPIAAKACETFKVDPTQGTARMSGGTVIQPGDLTETGEGIFYSPHPLPLADQRLIEFLKDAARSTPRRRARFCAHPSADADQHDMLIVSDQDSYIAPHRHLEKSETFIVLEGLVDIILFDEQGRVTEIFPMGPPSSGKPFFYRMPPRQFHALSIRSELLVFLESTKGPFRAGDNENAAWAPGPQEADRGRAYIASLVASAPTA